MGYAVGCLGLIPALFIGAAIRASVIVTIWGWFITPTWHIAAPRNAVAYGICCLVACFSDSPESPSKDGESATSVMVTAYAKIFLAPLMPLVGAWIVKNWWMQ